MRLRAALVLVPALAALASCGGGGQDVTKADYVAATDAVCTRVNTEISALDKSVNPADLASVGVYFDKVVTIAGTFTDELAAVKRPKADDAQIRTAFLDPLRRRADTLRSQLPKVTEAVNSGDPQALKKLKLKAPERPSVAALTAYGFSESCVKVAK